MMCYSAPWTVVSRVTGLSTIESGPEKRNNSVTIISQNVRGLKSEERINELFAIIEEVPMLLVYRKHVGQV